MAAVVLDQALERKSVGYVIDILPQRGRVPGPGKAVGGPIFAFYAEHKKRAVQQMLRSEGDFSHTKGSFGPRKHSFVGIFDTDRWITYLGLTRLEYEAFEKSYTLYRQGKDPAIRIEVLDKILTNLGRPDLFSMWYGDQPFRGEEEDYDDDDEVFWAA